MRPKTFDPVVPNSNYCSARIGAQIQNANIVQRQSCVCRRPNRSHENNQDTEPTNLSPESSSTLSQVRNINESTTSTSCSACTETRISQELPIINSVTKLHVGDIQSSGVGRLSPMYAEEDSEDDMTEPPPKYSDLFEKPSYSHHTTLDS